MKDFNKSKMNFFLGLVLIIMLGDAYFVKRILIMKPSAIF